MASPEPPTTTITTSTLKSKKKIYTAPLAHTPTFGSLDILPNAHIGVSPTGTILFIATSTPDLAASCTTHAFDSSNTTHYDLTPRTHDNKKTTAFLFPGLTDTHTHAPQYPNTGILGSSTLLSWLEKYTFPTESSFSSVPSPSIPDPKSHTRRIYTRVVNRLLSHGTTTAAYHATLHVDATNMLADLCKEKGQRALVGRVCMDRMSPEHYRDESVSSAVKDTEACIAHCRAIDPDGALVRPCITPRFAPSCTGELLSALGDLQTRHNESQSQLQLPPQSESESASQKNDEKNKSIQPLWSQTHISENSSEISLVSRLFPSSPNYASVYDSAKLLNPQMLLAHAVHLSPAEVSLIAERGAKVSHCPASNTALTSGAARVRMLIDSGITVGLGTDMSGGYSPSVLEMAKQALLVSRHVAMSQGDEHKLSVEEVLYLATLGGAKAVGLEDQVGSFEVGKAFDALLVRLDHVSEDGEIGEKGDGGPVDMLGTESWEDLLAKWLWTGDDRNVHGVWVKGRLVHSLGEIEESPFPTDEPTST